MDSWAARKRPWEEDTQLQTQNPRRDATTVAGEGPPLPQHAGHPSPDGQALSQRRLPPLYTPSCSASATSIVPGLLQLSPPPNDPDGLHTITKPRSQSLFNLFRSPKRQRFERGTEETRDYSSALDLDRSLPPIGIDTDQSRFATFTAPHATGEASCCPPSCEGQACSSSRSLMRSLASELASLHTNVKALTHKEDSLFLDQPDTNHCGTEKSLKWVLKLVQWTNIQLRDCTEETNTRSPHHSLFQPDQSPTMRRNQHHLEQREEQSPPSRQYSGHQHHHVFSAFPHPTHSAEDSRKPHYGGDMHSVANSPHHTVSSAGSVFMPPQSPMQAPQPMRSVMLPSPSSMNFPNVQNLPPISPPSAALQPSPQAVHLQDLQHQVSLKTLAFQTLQREYDSLLQKLERQRTKCATLEKKFEVSDVEINSLTDDKEKLSSQIVALEHQVEELQENRDEARRQLVANGAQYMRIMEMASRLQAQGAEDKRRWEAEKAGLEHRIKILEEAMVSGASTGSQEVEQSVGACSSSESPLEAHHLIPSASIPSAETVNVLRTEIGRLRSRTHTLEEALQTMKEESISIQQAAQKLVESGGRMEKAVQGAVNG
ncbi:hypothetical protein BS50DRAFT_107466 [Corynespora cassiicola Philippines]|uniref:Uncharacterized protein n=1 Tax=Corynespora cassiicola Philippines TaxID=1448308 RepID=A0A2T2NDB9_CORCC|nr:hypothetical protein BS50DRAFT_107466 [Corynespora cassiicola Philippines]